MNDLEKNILEEIARTNSSLKKNLKNHYSNIYVKNREFTGVGVYVNFEYKNNNLEPIRKNHLTGKAELMIPSLEFPVNYEIAITKGKISFMELVANEKEWNGEFAGFILSY